ncbi:RES family NAD+ phosphorylase [Megasphaera hexanoica]|uniref:RES family NAD+ phosphorylase n=1 Tax=Megasphaera hexanoica TaxID=1675036 RepID=A0ABW7DJZ1_9FIRM|nr:RES family NAD+ phosphorylase [Megasphaera hexanoica]AXB82367.1 hypothetical protein ACT01_09025 [Megasphaera hexanoica]
MQIGIDCFNDLQIRSIIQSENLKGHCDIQNRGDVWVYDTNKNQVNDLEANISSILSLYAPKNELEDNGRQSFDLIENRLYTDWRIFSPSISPTNIRDIVLAICKSEYSGNETIFQEPVGLSELSDSSFLKDNCLTGEKTWENFSNSLKHELRFHNHLNLDVLRTLLESETLHLKLNPKIELYRSRISNDGFYRKEEMGVPPASKASEGRVNSKGIPCLYLADTIETTLHEIRARAFDEITVAKFSPVKTVNMVDFRQLDKLSPFATIGIGVDWFAVNVEILHQISQEIAKPMRRNDSVLDYLPSQYIADFAKRLGYDGICFSSTLHQGGVNYAVFNEKTFVCNSVKSFQVKELKFCYKPVGDSNKKKS